jgi:UDP-glucose 4-epimerase
MSVRSVAVTGANGFLGSRVVAELAGADVRALVRAPVTWFEPAHQIVLDLLSPPEAIAEAIAGVDAVIHLAGHNEVVAAAEPDRALAETIVASRHITEAASLAGVPRLVYVSTVHVYGDRLSPGSVVDEDTAPAPRGPYAIARLASEHLVATAASPVVLRLTNAVGAPVHVDVNRWTLVAADLCRSAMSTGELVLRSTGQQWRDFIALDDVVRTLLAAIDPDELPSGTYNLASGRPMTVRALAELVQDRVEAATGVRPVLRAPAPDGAAPEPYHVDPGRLAALGQAARVPISDAVDAIIELCRQNAEQKVGNQ